MQHFGIDFTSFEFPVQVTFASIVTTYLSDFTVLTRCYNINHILSELLFGVLA